MIVGVIALTTLVWLATSDVRTSRAISFDASSREALAGNDLGRAYQQAEFAYALSPSDERALTLGSLAYLRRAYEAAERYFHAAGNSSEAIGGQAKIGEVAAAAAAGDEADFRRALDQVGEPAKELRVALAAATLDGGDISRTGETLAGERPVDQNITYLKSIGQSIEDIRDAQETQAAGRPGFERPSFNNPAYERFIRQLIAVPRNGNQQLTETFTRMAVATGGTSRQTFLGATLYQLDERRAALELAEQAVRDQPAYRDAWNVLAAAQISAGQLREAEQSLKVSVELDRSDGYTWYLRSKLAEAQNRGKQAEQYRARAQQLGYKQ